jgi:hypothetical protein
MKVAAFFDAERLRGGGAALARLAVALLDQGVSLTRLIPDDFDPLRVDPNERSIALLPRIEYPTQVPLWMRSARLERLIDQLSRDVPDLVFACGLGTWSMARGCAEALECPLVLELASSAEVARGQDARIARGAAGLLRLEAAPEPRPAASLPSAPAPANAAAPSRCALRPGVPPGRPCALLASGALRLNEVAQASSPTLALVGGCTSLEWWTPALDALRTLENSAPGWRGVVELNGPLEHEVWRLLRELNLADRVATISSAAALGPLVRRCDAMAVIEPLDHLSIPLLEAMAAEVAIAAVASEWVPLIDGHTGVVIGGAGGLGRSPLRTIPATAWGSAFERIAADRRSAEDLGRQAAGYVASEHRTSAQAEAMASWFRGLAEAPTLPFLSRVGSP